MESVASKVRDALSTATTSSEGTSAPQVHFTPADLPDTSVLRSALQAVLANSVGRLHSALDGIVVTPKIVQVLLYMCFVDTAKPANACAELLLDHFEQITVARTALWCLRPGTSKRVRRVAVQYLTANGTRDAKGFAAQFETQFRAACLDTKLPEKAVLHLFSATLPHNARSLRWGFLLRSAVEGEREHLSLALVRLTQRGDDTSLDPVGAFHRLQAKVGHLCRAMIKLRNSDTLSDDDKAAKTNRVAPMLKLASESMQDQARVAGILPVSPDSGAFQQELWRGTVGKIGLGKVRLEDKMAILEQLEMDQSKMNCAVAEDAIDMDDAGTATAAEPSSSPRSLVCVGRVATRSLRDTARMAADKGMGRVVLAIGQRVHLSRTRVLERAVQNLDVNLVRRLVLDLQAEGCKGTLPLTRTDGFATHRASRLMAWLRHHQSRGRDVRSVALVLLAGARTRAFPMRDIAWIAGRATIAEPLTWEAVTESMDNESIEIVRAMEATDQETTRTGARAAGGSPMSGAGSDLEAKAPESPRRRPRHGAKVDALFEFTLQRAVLRTASAVNPWNVVCKRMVAPPQVPDLTGGMVGKEFVERPRWATVEA